MEIPKAITVRLKLDGILFNSLLEKAIAENKSYIENRGGIPFHDETIRIIHGKGYKIEIDRYKSWKISW